jgi:predicted enzyme related to lactoylglutathione lyase
MVALMTSTIVNTTVDCARPWELAAFWAEVLGRPVHPDSEPGDVEVAIRLDHGGALFFQAVPEPKAGKNRVHLCLRPQERRDEEVSRLIAIGASLVDDRRHPDGTGWAVLADPEGNEFCVLRSSAERAATS